jgi:membrane protease YdiL (CAAX protease family)
LTPDFENQPGSRPPAPRARLAAWVARTRTYRWPRFLFEATLVALLLRIPVVWLGAPLVGTEARTAYDWLREYSVLELFVIAVLVGPIIETAVAQWAPIALGRRFFQRDAYAVLLSAWIFGWLHYSQGAMLVLIMFTTGLVLAWTFLVWRERGLWPAFAMTFGVHALLNSVALGAAMLAPQLTTAPT